MIKHVIWFLLIGIVSCSGGKTIIRSEPPTAFVTINEVPKGVTPLEIKLDCDKTKEIKVQISCPGYRTKTKILHCGKLWGPEKKIFFELEPGEEATNEKVPFAPQTPVDLGNIKIKSIPSEADVYFNDKFIGLTPLLKKGIKTGRYSLEVRKQGFKPWKEDIQINSNSTQEIFPILEEE